MRARAFLAPLGLLVLAALNAGADWARFRGPNGTGAVADKDVPVRWGEKDVAFKSPIPGTSHSSPIVVKGRVYLLSATNRERLVLCYDADGGKQLWAKAVPGSVGKMQNRKSSLASATPCSDGERLYCVFWDGRNVSLHGYDLSGKDLWHRDLGRFTSQHGPGFSPIVVDGKVIVNNDQDGAAVLLAFDGKTGEPAWQVERKPFRACYSTPFVLEQNAGKELVVTSTAGITGYALADGKELWHYAWSFPVKPLRTVGSSVVADGLVFGCSGDGDGSRHMIAVKLPGKGGESKPSLAWAKDSQTPYVPTFVAHEGHLYGVLDNGNALCFEAKTGKRAWMARLAGNVSASPLLIDGKVYVFDEKGDGYVFAASPEGLKVLAKNRVGEPVMATPAVVDGRLYIRGDKRLYCVGKKTKE
jgi:outer membrane protein assembly factor BamB